MVYQGGVASAWLACLLVDHAFGLLNAPIRHLWPHTASSLGCLFIDRTAGRNVRRTDEEQRRPVAVARRRDERLQDFGVERQVVHQFPKLLRIRMGRLPHRNNILPRRFCLDQSIPTLHPIPISPGWLTGRTIAHKHARNQSVALHACINPHILRQIFDKIVHLKHNLFRCIGWSWS